MNERTRHPTDETRTDTTLNLTHGEKGELLLCVEREVIRLDHRHRHSASGDSGTYEFASELKDRIITHDVGDGLELTERELDEIRAAVMARFRDTDERPVALLAVAEKLWGDIQFYSRPIGEVY